MRVFQVKSSVFFLMLLFFHVVPTISAQNNRASSTYQVTGRVISKADNRPVEYASLVLYNSTDSTPVDYTASSVTGDFTLSPKSEGEYFIAVSFIGYKPFETNRFEIYPEK